MDTIKRKSCRAVLLTPQNEILLIKVGNPDENWVGWITPGGGKDQNEDEIEALKRELYEELGLENFKVGPKIWTRFHKFSWVGKIWAQDEDFYFVSVNRFEPKPKLNPNDTEMMDLKEFRWWKLNEIKNSTDKFAPQQLYFLLQQIVEVGLPQTPIDAGV